MCDHSTQIYKSICMYVRKYLSPSSNIHSFPNLISLYEANVVNFSCKNAMMKPSQCLPTRSSD